MKIMIKYIFVFAMLCNSIFASSQISEIHSLKEIPLENMKPGTVIFLDMDENVLLSAHATQAPFKYLVSSREECRIMEPDLARTTLRMKTYLEADASKVIILGLTKRCMKYDSGVEDNVDRILQEKGVVVSRNRFQNLNGISLCNNPSSGFRNGIIFTGGGEKSPYAEEFFQLANITPSLIKFSDDVYHNLLEMISYSQKKGIPIDAYHMTRVRLLDTFIKGDRKNDRLPVMFDPDRYLHDHPDIFQAVAHLSVTEQFSFAQHHYLTWGIGENRFPGYPNDFCPNVYLSLNSGLEGYAKERNFDPIEFAWLHYRLHGHIEKRPYKK